MIVAAAAGVELEADCLELGGGLSIEHGRDVGAPPEAAWAEDGETARAVVVLRFERDDDDELPLPEARTRFRGLVEGLRLYQAGAVTLPGIGFARESEARWQPLELEGAGAARGEPLGARRSRRRGRCPASSQPSSAHHAAPGGLGGRPLRHGLLARAGRRGAVRLPAGAARAARRGRRGSLPLRLAALCAEEGERRGLQRRVELALALERCADGRRAATAACAAGSESPRVLAAEMEAHLRALLRDVLCGYLDADLGAVADDILLEVPEPASGEIAARDLREPEVAEAEVADGDDGDAERRHEEIAAVTPSADWTDFSAPV